MWKCKKCGGEIRGYYWASTCSHELEYDSAGFDSYTCGDCSNSVDYSKKIEQIAYWTKN